MAFRLIGKRSNRYIYRKIGRHDTISRFLSNRVTCSDYAIHKWGNGNIPTPAMNDLCRESNILRSLCVISPSTCYLIKIQFYKSILTYQTIHSFGWNHCEIAYTHYYNTRSMSKYLCSLTSRFALVWFLILTVSHRILVVSHLLPIALKRILSNRSIMKLSRQVQLGSRLWNAMKQSYDSGEINFAWDT